jgi:dTDP-4-dehydrorhamnose 3,5-epimerase
MVKISKTKLKGVLLISPDIFRDFRGEFLGTYDEKLYRKVGIRIKFVEDDISISRKNILRGIHSDSKAWKLMSCIKGKIYEVVVNCDEKSKDFGKWQGFLLSDRDKKQILVPPKYGCSFLVLSKEIIFTYKQSEYYDPKRQSTYLWNDPRFKIKWPVKHPILSQRDKKGHYIKK